MIEAKNEAYFNLNVVQELRAAIDEEAERTGHTKIILTSSLGAKMEHIQQYSHGLDDLSMCVRVQLIHINKPTQIVACHTCA